MSSQFSYELDERQIRILMQSAELSYSETAWQRFDSLAVETTTHTKTAKFIPNINFNFSVSRSIIVPIIFIALIGSLSVLLFSFVDFKKKEEVVLEKPLIIPTPETKKAERKPIVTHKAVKTNVAVSVDTKNTIKTMPAQPVNNKAVATNTEVKKEEVAKPVDTKTIAAVIAESKAKQEDALKNTEAKSKETIITPIVAKKSSPAPVTKKKRKRRMVSDELPSISTTPATLSSSENEPELDIK